MNRALVVTPNFLEHQTLFLDLLNPQLPSPSHPSESSAPTNTHLSSLGHDHSQNHSQVHTNHSTQIYEWTSITKKKMGACHLVYNLQF